MRVRTTTALARNFHHNRPAGWPAFGLRGEQLDYANVRRTGSGAAFATTQVAVRDRLRSSRSGRHESANALREDFVPRQNCPTQAKTRLEWATRQTHPHNVVSGNFEKGRSFLPQVLSRLPAFDVFI